LSSAPFEGASIDARSANRSSCTRSVMLAKLSRSSSQFNSICCPCAKYAQLFRGATVPAVRVRMPNRVRAFFGRRLVKTVATRFKTPTRVRREYFRGFRVGTETEVQRCGTEEFIMWRSPVPRVAIQSRLLCRRTRAAPRLGFSESGRYGVIRCYSAPGAKAGGIVDLRAASGFPRGFQELARSITSRSAPRTTRIRRRRPQAPR
jgi:hypothetical protein